MPMRPPIHRSAAQVAYQAAQDTRRHEHDRKRGNSTKRGYGARWNAEARAYLASHGNCVMCLREGKHLPAQVVDHVVPHQGNMRLFWDRSNWQALCKSHHSSKTASTDG